MAYRSNPLVLGTGDTDIYEVPVTFAAVVVLGIHNANANPRTITLKYYKDSTAQTLTFVSGLTIAANTSIKLAAPFSMEAGDKLIGSASNSDSVFVTPFITDSAATPVAVGFTPRGVWSNLETYVQNDVVNHNGSVYYAKANETANIDKDPASQTAFWMPGPSKGDPGDLTESSLFVLLGQIVDPVAAPEASGDITLDVEDGAVNFFKRTAAGNEEVQVPANMPDGWTIYLRLDPNGNAITWATGYVGSDNTLPSPDGDTLFAIVRDNTEYIVTQVGQSFGDGS